MSKANPGDLATNLLTHPTTSLVLVQGLQLQPWHLPRSLLLFHIPPYTWAYIQDSTGNPESNEKSRLGLINLSSLPSIFLQTFGEYLLYTERITCYRLNTLLWVFAKAKVNIIQFLSSRNLLPRWGCKTLSFSPFLSLSLTHRHTHVHTHIHKIIILCLNNNCVWSGFLLCLS